MEDEVTGNYLIPWEAKAGSWAFRTLSQLIEGTQSGRVFVLNKYYKALLCEET